MLLSFHPLLTGDENIICAGRKPNEDDLEAIRRADVVILPLGCKQDLYFMARNNCELVFPNYDARFSYPGKIGQIRLFRKTEVKHPRTLIYENVASLIDGEDDSPVVPPMDIPFVFKFDWGGEGKNVYLIQTPADWRNAFELARRYETTGQKGFLVQERIDSGNRSLRSVVVGAGILSYWRVAKEENRFKSSLSSGAGIDYHSNRELIAEAEKKLSAFLERTGIDLAGFDFLLSADGRDVYMLEINYFFGRRGLGGSKKFNLMLVGEINRWLAKVGRAERVSFDEN
jgi:ribosomal protein S6--L-glutamate ligase